MHLKPSGPSSKRSGSILFLIRTGRMSFWKPGNARAGVCWQDNSKTPRDESAARFESSPYVLRLSVHAAHRCPTQENSALLRANQCVRFAVEPVPDREIQHVQTDGRGCNSQYVRLTYLSVPRERWELVNSSSEAQNTRFACFQPPHQPEEFQRGARALFTIFYDRLLVLTRKMQAPESAAEFQVDSSRVWST